MCHCATDSGGAPRPGWAARILLLGAAAALVSAQTAPVRPEWRRIGSAGIEAQLAGPASGAVDRVWFSADGSTFFALTASGRVLQTANFEKWEASSAVPPADTDQVPAVRGLKLARRHPVDPARLYAISDNVVRSEDGGATWANLTAFQNRSIIGDGMRDLAVSPRDGDEIVVANRFGLWRSVDGGLSWTGLNDALPNLPVRRIAGLPQTTRGVRIEAEGFGIVEWAPGEKRAWQQVRDAADDSAARRTASQVLEAEITALAASGDFAYAGAADGRVWSSADRGRTWNIGAQPAERGAVEAFHVDATEPRIALAAVAVERGGRVLRTVNGGQFWDDISADLPDGAAHGVAADRATGSVYVATDRGLFTARADLNAPSPASRWTSVPGLPAGRVLDAKLDAEGNQLFVAVEGSGIHAALAPHRVRSLRLVSAADLSSRPAAPGALLSVLGGRVITARAGEMPFPVLATSDTESQIQVPFGVSGPAVAVALRTATGDFNFAIPVESVAPAIFTDRDGTPLILNADTGVLLDGMNSATSNGRLQILATGLGRVRPDWQAGRAAPSENPPEVVAPVRAYLDRSRVEVARAVLAPGYVGLYLVEIQLPAIVNYGPAELYIEAGNQASNRVRINIEP